MAEKARGWIGGDVCLEPDSGPAASPFLAGLFRMQSPHFRETAAKCGPLDWELFFPFFRPVKVGPK
jgi:hypothetical protein